MAARLWSTWVATELWYPILADVLAIHDAMMRSLGENPAPLMAEGPGKLESAIATPIWAALYAEADLAEQAAILSVRLAQAHAFVDNNKRLAYMVGVIFLRENGHPLPAEQSLVFAKLIESGVEHTKTISDIGGWLRDTI